MEETEASNSVEYINPPDDAINPDGRAHLPSNMLQREQISVWSILKQSIGKELSKITMPVVFNEPISFLQRITEYMEYCYVIKKASDEQDPVRRLELVAAFAVSALASNWERVAKPFNPLLGETYELDRVDDLGFRIVCEQVSHHPPISAFHADSPLFKFYGSIYPKLKFWGRSVEIQPRGVITLELPRHKEVYTWSNVNCSVHNLVMGKMYIEQHGCMEIINHTNGMKCVLNFKPNSSWFGRDFSNHIEGNIFGKNKEKLKALYGSWTDFLASCSTETFEQNFAHWGKEQKEHKRKENDRLISQNSVQTESRTTPLFKSASVVSSDDEMPEPHLTPLPVLKGSQILWRATSRPQNSEKVLLNHLLCQATYCVFLPNRDAASPIKFYHFTAFALILNSMDRTQDLPPTDSRLRPDMRQMEDGDWDGAASEKHRLEEKQRATRNGRKKEKADWQPTWFNYGRHTLVREDTWHFNDQYWKKDWSRCPDIF